MSTVTPAPVETPAAPPSRLAIWVEALRTTNVPPGVSLDPVAKWLVVTRASVLPMTLMAAGIGGALALADHSIDVWLFALCTLGLVLAHVSNNLMNDFFDTRSGVDTPGYARTEYAPHPLLSGLVSERELLLALAVVNALDLAIALYLTWARGPLVLVFAFAGFAISFFYVAPPLRFKHHGLGEPSVFVIWGPLMVGGSYYVASGELAAAPFWASLPYGLLVMCVLFGKHIDKHDADAAKHIHTLPVLLGAERARQATRAMIAGFFVVVLVEVALGVLSPWTLAVFLGLPRTRRVWRAFSEPPPDEPPKGYPLWPLWYVAAAFVLIRRVGLLLVAGLLLELVIPLR